MYSVFWLRRILLYADADYKYGRQNCPPPVLGGWKKPSLLDFLPVKSPKISKLLFQIADDCFGAGANIQLPEDLFDMSVHRPDTDAHGLRYLLVHIALA